MKYLKRINESKRDNKINDLIESLKDALTELSDSRKTIVQRSVDNTGHYTIEIAVKLDYYCVQESMSGITSPNVEELKLIMKKSHDEMMDVFDLVSEGIVRSQIDYTSSAYDVSTEDSWDWDNVGGDYGYLEDASDALVFTLLLGSV